VRQEFFKSLNDIKQLETIGEEKSFTSNSQKSYHNESQPQESEISELKNIKSPEFLDSKTQLGFRIANELLGVIADVFGMLYYISDHFSFMGKIEVIQNPKIKKVAGTLGDFFWLYECIPSLIRAILQWLILKPSLPNATVSKIGIKKTKSRFSKAFESNNPTIKHYVFDSFSVQDVYTKYFDLNREFDLIESFCEFQSWLKFSPISNIIHKFIDLLVICWFQRYINSLDIIWILLS
jgi:hypothetical protein